MKKTLFINTTIFLLLLSATASSGQSAYIFFYKPYTDSLETNLYEKNSLKFDFKTQYNNIKNADVEFEVDNAIKHNDYRFVVISGNSYLFPGLENDIGGNFLKKYKFKVIMGTSDAINMQMPPLQNLAYNYAKSYNILMISKIKKMETGKSRRK